MNNIIQDDFKKCIFAKKTLSGIKSEIFKNKISLHIYRLEILRNMLLYLKLKIYNVDCINNSIKSEIEDTKNQIADIKELIKNLNNSKKKYKIKSNIKNQ